MTLHAIRARAPIAVLAAAALLATGTISATAAGPLTAYNASTVTAGTYASDVVVGDFTVKATAAKAVTVDAGPRTSDRGDTYTQRLKLNGAGDAAQRSLQFTVDAATEVVVHARSASGTADRTLALYDAAWTVVDSAPALADDASLPVATATLDVPAAGTYWLASPSSGVNLYFAQLGADAPVERTPWADVSAPVIDAITPAADAPSRLAVSFTGLIGPAGADLASAVLYDAAGTVVDRGLTAVRGESGTILLSPASSGNYTAVVSLTRAGEPVSLDSVRVNTPAFVLPLAPPEISGALTTDVSDGAATVTLDWSASPEAETYSIETSLDGVEFTTVLDGVIGTSANVPGLTTGTTYQMRVTAHRGQDAATGAATDVAVTAAVERWQIADIGSNANSGGSVTENADGSITFDAKASTTKLAASEDGFQYYYTQIDPTTENFTLTATFTVDDASSKDNQSGFGIIAVDDLVPGDTAHRYFNSAGALITRYGEGTGALADGMPGARFVTGYTGSTNDNTAGARSTKGSEVFDPTYRADATGPKFTDGDVYSLTLRKSNTGFHAIWTRDGVPVEVIAYDPDMLLQQNPDTVYVGFAVARKIVVTVSDWELTTIHPDDDEVAQQPPTTYVPTTLDVDITSTTPERRLDIPLVASFHGTGQILDAEGRVVVDGLPLVPGQQALGTVELAAGQNHFTARATPGPDQPQLGEYEELESTDPVDAAVSITVSSYGVPGQSIWVAPDAGADGAGTRADPLDLRTAVAYAQPGQQIVLEGGTYTPHRAVVVERGRDGTADAPITLMSAPGDRAVLDLSESGSGGLHLRGDWWHVYDLEITGSGDKLKPMLIQGNHNIVERVSSHHNQDTGIQISGLSSEPRAMWPSHNLVVSSQAHHNADPAGNDADGFAAKLTVGDGNVFRYSIAHNNIDDGWDLYAKSTTGSIGTVVVEQSVAYNNGYLSQDPSRTGEGNGFKLGGESMPGEHLLANSISYGNLATGVSSNSGPDVRLENVTTVGNDRGVRLDTNAATTNYRASGVLSWLNPRADVLGLKQSDRSLLSSPSNYFDGTTADASDGRPATVSESWFVTTDSTAVRPEIAADGSIEMHGLYELTDAAPSDTGARLMANPDPTQIVVLPEVSPPSAGPDAWFPSTVYPGGEVVQHDGVVYEARWWTRNQEPGRSPGGPWVAVGRAEAPPAVTECSAPWDASRVYLAGDVVERDGVNHRAQWWTRGQDPAASAWGAWSAVGACR